MGCDDAHRRSDGAGTASYSSSDPPKVSVNYIPIRSYDFKLSLFTLVYEKKDRYYVHFPGFSTQCSSLIRCADKKIIGTLTELVIKSLKGISNKGQAHL